MTIGNRPHLQQLNPFLNLNLNHIAVVNFDYHKSNTFPVNIIVLVLEDDGQGCDYLENKAANQHLPLKVGYIYFIPADLEINFEITHGITFIALHFALEFLHGIDLFSGVTHCEMVYEPDFAVEVRGIINDTNELRSICALKAKIMCFCSLHWPERTERLILTFRKYEPVFQYVREYGNANTTVAKLADISGMRQDVFSRTFSCDLGKSPKEFLKQNLIKKIIMHLLTPGINVKQAADKLKFSSEFYLSRFFKQQTGLSPSEYQRRFRSHNIYKQTP